MKQIPLTQGKFALVDDRDFEYLNQFKWHANFCHGTWYACRYASGEKSRARKMHQEILPGYPKVDHKNGDGLDNQRSNLRPTTLSQNRANSRKTPGCSSQFKGVSWHTKSQKWMAGIKVAQKSFNLGLYHIEEEAARAYDKAAKQHFGEFARLNFP